jgi:tRNA-2-methylthio-N6-dimethylallyladenosine synthase
MNSRDSEFIAGLFLEKGYEFADSSEEADVILFNTCSVREHAEKRAISNMGALLKDAVRSTQYARRAKRIFGIVGCVAQAAKQDLFKRLPGLDIVCGTGEIAQLPAMVLEAKKKKVLALDNIDTYLPDRDPAYRKSKGHAYVEIMRGCDNFCSYCVVPYVRGKERSRKAGDIVNEIEGLAKRGIKDITLLGQNVNSYNISFMTSHPKDASIELFETMRDLEKLVKHLHLPMQAGSDRILELMERGYTIGRYRKLVSDARDIIPDLRLTTDAMVGFPTESEKDFNETLNLVKEIQFDLAYVFMYSPRPGTKATGMADDVPEDTKKRRHRILLDLQRDISRRKKYEKNDNFSHC